VSAKLGRVREPKSRTGTPSALPSVSCSAPNPF
jgi:hypothetical protein